MYEYTEKQAIRFARLYGDLLEYERALDTVDVEFGGHSNRRFVRKAISSIKRYRMQVPEKIRHQLFTEEELSRLEELANKVWKITDRKEKR